MTTTWPGPIFAITVFADDLAATREFYDRVFGAPVVNEDDVSAAYQFENLIINVLQTAEAPELVDPAPVAPASAGVRMQFTINVDDVDATHALLTETGVTFLNGPIDRPWGIRTAAFQDPAGHVWEIAS